MYRYRRDEDEDENLAPIVKAIKGIGDRTEATYSAKSQVEQAFLLGLWYKSFPQYMHEHLEKTYCWSYQELMPENTNTYQEPYGRLLKFSFISDTGDSWHQCYRDLRELGWQRLKVHRDGGQLQYLLKIEDQAGKPEGFKEIHLVLDISISTCVRIQVGTEMQEVPVYKTVCEDLKELNEETAETPAASFDIPAEATEVEYSIKEGILTVTDASPEPTDEGLQHLHDEEARAVADTESDSKDDIPF